MPKLVEQDHQFAHELDIACEACRKTCNNRPQLGQLNQREKTHPKEKRVIWSLKKQCNSCHAQGKPEGRAITDTTSCLFRSPPDVKE